MENSLANLTLAKKYPKIDCLFLDIHLPELTGLEFLESLANPPLTILTTAYSEFALEGYRLNVVDYLLKPIEYSRFLEAVHKTHVVIGSRELPVSKYRKKELLNSLILTKALVNKRFNKNQRPFM